MKLEYVHCGRMTIVSILGAPHLVGMARLRRGDHHDAALGLGVALVKAAAKLRGGDKQAYARVSGMAARGRVEMPEDLLTSLMLKQIEYRMVRAQEVREERNGNGLFRARTTMANPGPGPAAKAAERLGKALIQEWQKNYKWTALADEPKPKAKSKAKAKGKAKK